MIKNVTLYETKRGHIIVAFHTYMKICFQQGSRIGRADCVGKQKYWTKIQVLSYTKLCVRYEQPKYES